MKKNKYYFVDELSTEFCYTMDSIKDKMKFNDLKSVNAYEAIKEKSSEYFYCKEYGEIGEKHETCGKRCGAYDPKNGKSGCCKKVGSLFFKSVDFIKIEI